MVFQQSCEHEVKDYSYLLFSGKWLFSFSPQCPLLLSEHCHQSTSIASVFSARLDSLLTNCLFALSSTHCLYLRTRALCILMIVVIAIFLLTAITGEPTCALLVYFVLFKMLYTKRCHWSLILCQLAVIFYILLDTKLAWWCICHRGSSRVTVILLDTLGTPFSISSFVLSSFSSLWCEQKLHQFTIHIDSASAFLHFYGG